MSVLASHPCVSPSPSVCLSVDEDINLMQIASTEHNRSANCASFNAQCAPFSPPRPATEPIMLPPFPAATVAPSSVQRQRQTGEARTDIAKCNGSWSLKSGKGLQCGFSLGSLRMRDADNGPLMDVLQRGKALPLHFPLPISLPDIHKCR